MGWDGEMPTTGPEPLGNAIRVYSTIYLQIKTKHKRVQRYEWNMSEGVLKCCILFEILKIYTHTEHIDKNNKK